MNTHLFLRGLICTGIGVLGAAAAQAQSSSYGYGGISVGQSQGNLNVRRINESQMPPGVATVDISRDSHDTGYKLFGGYQYNTYMALEGGYFNLGRFNYQATTSPPGTVTDAIGVQGINLDLVGTLPLTGSLSALGRVGAQYARTKNRFETSGAAVISNPNPSKREVNYKLGLGLQYEVSPSMLVRAEVEHYRLNDAVEHRATAHLIAVSLVFPFGRTATPVPHAAMAPMPMAAAPEPLPTEPTAAGAPAPMAAPEPPRKRVSFSAESLFGFDQAGIQSEGRAELDTLSKELVGTEFSVISVEGHTDRIGTAEYNQQLSDERAAAVKDYLVKSGGVDPSKITATGKGESAPVTHAQDCKGSKDSPKLRACLKADRRVEVEVTGTTSGTAP